jgi:uncharacterized protein (DUF433 family)
MIEARIIELGRGPTIEGSRITVFDVLHYHQAGWYRDEIAAFFRLSSRQVQVALQYIEEHKEEVMATNAKIEARIARGNPPELQAKLDASKGAAQARREELRRKKSQEIHGEGYSGGH